MVINEKLARGYWPDGDPLGECVTVDSDSACTAIVGIVQNVLMFNMVNDERSLIYLPATHPLLHGYQRGALLVRATERAPISAAVLRREIQGIAPNMPYLEIRPYEVVVAPELQPWRLGATMFGIFGVVALLIAAVGLYSVIAYLVSQRTHEIGVRMALGARRQDVVRLVLGEGLQVALIGLGLGIVVALLAGRFVVDLLYETSPRDPAIIGAVAAILTVVAAAAAIVPSWRASRVDPVSALRAE
jgi:ABC-type antimicrobial peptide transport system permease subunit